jgi:hypothetical protein
MTPGAAVALLAALLAALAGVVLSVLTQVVSALDIGGAGWSLRGSGALVVMFSGVAATLAGGWVTLSLWRVGHPRWGAWGVVAGATALGLAWFARFAPLVAVSVTGEGVLRGRETGASGTETIAVLGITFLLPLALSSLAGLVLAGSLGLLRRTAVVAGAVLLFGSLAMVAVQPGLFFLIGPPLVVPLLVSAPTIVAARRRRGTGVRFRAPWLWLAWAAVLFGLLAGLAGAEWVQGMFQSAG